MITFAYSKFLTTPRMLVDLINSMIPSSARLLHYSGRRIRSTGSHDLVVNWGYTGNVSAAAGQNILNRSINGSKLQQFAAIASASVEGLRCPPSFTEYGALNDITCPDGILVRRDGAHGGAGISFYRHASECPASLQSGQFYVKFIDKTHEFRVHVVGDAAVGWSTKTPGSSGDVAWNNATGGRQENFKNKTMRPVLQNVAVIACRVLGYDFGAVDIIMDKMGLLYVLEVNSAPALTGGARKIWSYAKFFMQSAGYVEGVDYTAPEPEQQEEQ